MNGPEKKRMNLRDLVIFDTREKKRGGNHRHMRSNDSSYIYIYIFKKRKKKKLIIKK